MTLLRPSWAAALCALAAVASAQPATPAAATPGDAVVVLPGARNVQRSSQPDGADAAYELDAEFPAAKPILEIVNRLAKLGWQPLKEDPMNPGLSTSMVSGWTSFFDSSKSPRTRRYNWASEWKDGKGNAVFYAFGYEAPEGSRAPLRSLRVTAGVHPSKGFRRISSNEAALAEMRAHGRCRPTRPGPEPRSCRPATGTHFWRPGPRARPPSPLRRSSEGRRRAAGGFGTRAESRRAGPPRRPRRYGRGRFG